MEQDGGRPAALRGRTHFMPARNYLILNYRERRGWCVPTMITCGAAD